MSSTPKTYTGASLKPQVRGYEDTFSPFKMIEETFFGRNSYGIKVTMTIPPVKLSDAVGAAPKESMSVSPNSDAQEPELPYGMAEIRIPKSIIQMYKDAPYAGNLETIPVLYYEDSLKKKE